MKYIKNAVTGEIKHLSNEDASILRQRDPRWNYVSKFEGREKLGRPKGEDNG